MSNPRKIQVVTGRDARTCHTCSTNVMTDEVPVDAMVDIRLEASNITTVITMCPSCSYRLEVALRQRRERGR